MTGTERGKPCRQVLLLLATCALGSSACGVRAHGELTVQECADGNDQDGDDTTDCDDSDCWIYEICGQTTKATRVEDDAGARAAQEDAGPPIAPAMEDAAVPEAVDSAVPPEDSGPEVLLPCGEVGGSLCADDDVCFFGTCFPPNVQAQTYLLRVAWANLPVRPGISACFDSLDLGCLGPFECSNCLPDPYVITTLNGAVQDQTAVARDKVAPSWNEPYFEIHLKGGDDLTFSVFDDDTGVPDTLILTCTLDLASTSASGGVQCRPDADADYYVTVEFKPGPVSSPE